MSPWFLEKNLYVLSAITLLPRFKPPPLPAAAPPERAAQVWGNPYTHASPQPAFLLPPGRLHLPSRSSPWAQDSRFRRSPLEVLDVARSLYWVPSSPVEHCGETGLSYDAAWYESSWGCRALKPSRKVQPLQPTPPHQVTRGDCAQGTSNLHAYVRSMAASGSMPSTSIRYLHRAARELQLPN